jgi:hypothetical protein
MTVRTRWLTIDESGTAHPTSSILGIREGQVTRITGIAVSAADLDYRSTLMTKVKAERAIADTPEAEVLRSLLP